MESLRSGDCAGSGNEGSFTSEQAAKREACAARPVPASVLRQREAATDIAISRVMAELNDQPMIITMDIKSRHRVEA